ncbi:MAG TPA: hypothetical protein VM049_02235 [Gaiellaceae bacterium]|nr:hypothetical protein [Gaiellaceae bacterium]
MKTTAQVGRTRQRVAVFAALLLCLGATLGVVQAQAAKSGKVLILASTVSGGTFSDEAKAAAALGLDVDLVTDATWAAMTTAQFAGYDALILGDATCTGLGSGAATATANASVWGAAVDGNVITIGTDEVYHRTQGGLQVTNNLVAFAADADGKTGMMISLSCYYHGTAPATPVPVLAPFGSFTATGVGCYNDAHIVATHPALTSLTDASLSNWSCSVHEAFDNFPSDFIPLVVAQDSAESPLPGSKGFPDGTRGVPYVLARGEGLRLVRQIDLTPDSATNPVGTSHTLTATVRENGTPVAETRVTFTVLSGPNAGRTGTDDTDADGKATFTYTDTGGAGTDTIQATYRDREERLQESNIATKTWGSAAAPASPPPADIGVTKTDSPDPVSVGSNLTYTLVVKNFGPGPATGAELSDRLPSGVTFVSLATTRPSCAFAAGEVKCAFGSLALNETATVTVVVRVDQAGTITNTAGVSTTVADPNVGNNQVATAVTTAQGPFTPPAVPEAPVATGCALTTGTPSVFAGVRSTLTIRARYDDGSARAGVTLTLRGVGKTQSGRTDAKGLARFTVLPKRAGQITIRGAGCAAAATVAAVMSQNCAGLSVTPKSATVGGRAVINVRIRIAGKPAVGVRVLARGAGLSASGLTDSAGVAALRGIASSPGVVTISVPGILACSRRIGVSGAFLPPEVTG